MAKIAEKSRRSGPSSINEGLVAALLRIYLSVTLSIACVIATLGCERQIAPPLVDVLEIAPREVEVGDRFEIHGTGFPQGRGAHVTFQGALFRPGAEPQRGVTIEADGVTTTSDRVELVVREAFAERFCGRGDSATHATFRGEVRVGFASSTPGAPPLVGRLREASIDVLPPSVRANVQDARSSEGSRVLGYFGLVTGAPTAHGLPIEQVRAGSPAERHGIQVGDVLSGVDGVHVLSTSDVLPISSRTTDLTMLAGGTLAPETKTISMANYATERVPSEFTPALLLVGFAFALLVLLLLPGPPALAALELKIAARVRGTTLRAAARALVGSGLVCAASAIASALLAAFALAPFIVGRELDGVMLLAMALSMVVWSRIAVERGVLASLRTLLRLGAAALVMVGALVVGIGQVGAIELAEIVRIQGGAPWEFTAARHPACAILLVVYAVALVSILRIRTVRPAIEAAPEVPRHALLLERGGVLFASGLAVTTFLGGWQLPGVTEPRTRGLLLLAAALFVLKTWAFAGFVLAMSRLSTSYTPRDVVAIVAKRLIWALVLAAVLVALSRRLVPSAAIETAFAGTLVAMTALLIVRLAARVRAALSRPEPHASPFL